VDVEFVDTNATPDEYALCADGDLVDADIDPADVLVSGDDYRSTRCRLRGWRGSLTLTIPSRCAANASCTRLCTLSLIRA
jgi:hypothetical protein